MTEENSKTLDMVEEHHHLQEKLITSEYYEREREIFKILNGLGFEETDFTRQTDEFSGGWQMRIALARVLLELRYQRRCLLLLAFIRKRSSLLVERRTDALGIN